MAEASGAPTPRVEKSSGWLVPSPVVSAVVAIAIIAAFGFAFRDFFSLQYHYATVKASDWGHTLFIPLIALYVVFLHKADLFERPFKTAWAGLGTGSATLETARRGQEPVDGQEWTLSCVRGGRATSARPG